MKGTCSVLAELPLHIDKSVLKFTAWRFLFMESGVHGPAIKSQMISARRNPEDSSQRSWSFASLGRVSPITPTRWTAHRNLSGCENGCTRRSFFFIVKLFAYFLSNFSDHSCGEARECVWMLSLPCHVDV